MHRRQLRPMMVRTARAVLAALICTALVPASAIAVAPPVPGTAAESPQAAALSAALFRDGLDGVHALAADDDIPGIVVSSPYSSAIDLNAGDWVDVLRVSIPAGTVFTADIAMSYGEWVAGALFPPGSPSLEGDAVPVQYSQVYDDSHDRLSYYSQSGGTYYLVLFPGDDGSGEFFGDGYMGYTVTFQSNTLTGDYDVGTANALPASRSDSLHWQTDINDVFEIDLAEGQQLQVTMTPGGTSDFDLLFYGPNSPSVWTSDAIIAQYDWSSDSPDSITWLVPPGGGGTYHLEVYTRIDSGGYTMTTAVTTPNVPRVFGSNRYSTSAASSKSTWTTSDSVVLATGTDPADALAASGIAGVLDAPVVLVPPYNKVGDVFGVYYELARLSCTDVYIVGGDAAVDPWIDADLDAMGYTVTRLYGANRYLTAAAVAEEMRATAVSETAFVVRGDDYADALAVSPYAFSQGIPVLLTRTGELYGATADFIEDNDITNVVVAGGEAAVSNAVVAQLDALNGGATNVNRVFGSSRYATAKAVADYAANYKAWANWDFVGVATGESFPDALSGGAVCGRRGGVLLLTRSASLRPEVSDSITAESPDTVMIFGGTAAVSAGVATSIQNLMP